VKSESEILKQYTNNTTTILKIWTDSH